MSGVGVQKFRAPDRRETIFCILGLGPNIFVPSVWNVLRFTLLAPRNFRKFAYRWRTDT